MDHYNYIDDIIPPETESVVNPNTVLIKQKNNNEAIKISHSIEAEYQSRKQQSAETLNLKFDARFHHYVMVIEVYKKHLPKILQIRTDKWMEKLELDVNNFSWKKNRNMHTVLLLDMVLMRDFKQPFHKIPEDGPVCSLLSKDKIKVKDAQKRTHAFLLANPIPYLDEIPDITLKESFINTSELENGDRDVLQCNDSGLLNSMKENKLLHVMKERRNPLRIKPENRIFLKIPNISNGRSSHSRIRSIAISRKSQSRLQSPIKERNKNLTSVNPSRLPHKDEEIPYHSHQILNNNMNYDVYLAQLRQQKKNRDQYFQTQDEDISLENQNSNDKGSEDLPEEYETRSFMQIPNNDISAKSFWTARIQKDNNDDIQDAKSEEEEFLRSAIPFETADVRKIGINKELLAPDYMKYLDIIQQKAEKLAEEYEKLGK